MSQALAIRTATLADLEVLLQFEQGVVAAERPFNPTLKPGELSYYDIPALMQDPLTHLVVAELGSEVIASGFARIERAKAYLNLMHYAYLGFMYVKPPYRGRGVNSRILDELKRWAVNQGITELRLEVYANNDVARKAYEKFGFQPHNLEMRLGL